jgi:hypothetical protein
LLRLIPKLEGYGGDLMQLDLTNLVPVEKFEDDAVDFKVINAR